MYHILKGELNNPIKFKEKIRGYIQELKRKERGIGFNVEELSELLLAACRTNDFNIITLEGKKRFLNENRVLDWIRKKLRPNTIIVSLDDEDIVRLLIFCIEITYQMFAGGTRATITQKGFRESRRTFESILVNQFVGKFGEIIVKKFLERNFSTKIDLDWEISPDIERYRNDIANAKKKVSIKSSLSSAGAWAEANLGYDYGIHVKCFVPRAPILQFFIEACGFSKLLNFAEKKIPPYNGRFKGYLKKIRKRIKDYKCGKIKTDLKGFICGYFKTSEYTPIKKGETLNYLGEVKEERYLIQINELKYTKEDWTKFLQDTGLI